MTDKTDSTKPAASPGTASRFYDEGKQAVARGDLAQAERSFRQALDLDPAHARASHWLASILIQGNRKADAEVVLINAAGKGALSDSLRLLAEIFETSNREAQAAICYEALLKSVPGDYAALMKLAAVRNKLEDNAGEADCYRHAMEARPGDLDATFKYADAIWKKQPELAVRAVEALLATCGDDLARRVSILSFLLCRKEWWERIRRGEMPYHCAKISELLFNYAADEARAFEKASAALVAAHPQKTEARLNHGTAKFCLGDRHGAEALWQPETLAGSIWETVRFSPAFYDHLNTYSDDDLVRNLPPLLTLSAPRPDQDGALYLSCNALYFHAFALPMILSLHERSPNTPAHIHIMDMSDKEAAHALGALKTLGGEKFTLSIERPGFTEASVAARCYYHAIRLIRFYEHLRKNRTPLWLMDVDAVINRDVGELFGMLHGSDVAMRIRPGRMEPWNQFNACVVGANTSTGSLTYFRRLAAYIAYFHQRDKLRWGIDQLAMYGVFTDAQDRGQEPSLKLLGEREVDYDYREDGFVWCNSGVAKFKHLQRVANPGANIPPDQNRGKFTEVFEHYWKRTQTIAQEAAPAVNA